jgi:SAM-dependent methyltransferase
MIPTRSDVSAKEAASRVLSQLLEAEKARTCGPASSKLYADLHKTRFADILRLCRSEVPDSSARVLDIGRSELTTHLLNFYRDVHTLGLDPVTDDGGHRESGKLDGGPHITFDLLDSHTISKWPDPDRFDLIVFSEVIEHLWVAPEFVFAFLESLLTDQGVLICTTPNAADIGKRVKLVLGRNPYERLRLYSINPGHIREYTRQELCDIADSVGLRCKGHFYFNWMAYRSGNSVKAAVMKLLRAYPPFRPFQACILSKKSTPPLPR